VKLIVEVPDESFDDALHLMAWLREHRITPEGEVVRIGTLHDESVFASRVLSLTLEVP
jgi:hypothetical protein